MRCSYPACLFGLIFLMLGEFSAYAQTPLPSCADDPICQKLLTEGDSLFQAGQLDEAAEKFSRAYDRWLDPILLFKLARLENLRGDKYLAAKYEGRAFARMGRYKEAEEHFAQACQMSEHPDPDLLFRRARALHQLGQLKSATKYYQQVLDARGGAQEVLEEQKRRAKGSLEQIAKGATYRKWWFWTVVGVAATGICLGVGLTVAAQRPDVSGAVAVRPFAN